MSCPIEPSSSLAIANMISTLKW